MSKTMQWKPGDPCPNCGDPVKLMPLPSDEQRRKAADRYEPIPIPQTFDTATPEQIDEHGRLYRCVPCWSQFRVKETAPAAGSSHE